MKKLFSPKFKVLFRSGLSWLALLIVQLIGNTRPPSTGGKTECFIAGFIGWWFRVDFPTTFLSGATISVTLATEISFFSGLKNEITISLYANSE